MTRYAMLALAAGGIVTVGLAGASLQLPVAGAYALLHPARQRVGEPPPDGVELATFQGADVSLAGWRFGTARERRGTIVYLHGVADNRASSLGVAQRFTPRGFDVIAYDSRAHGDSGGDVCTYGFYERHDLARVLDAIPAGPIVVIGSSLGAAVALQAAAGDRRITAVVAAESFADLATIARERAPWFFSRSVVDRALAKAEALGRFTIADVSPVEAASRIEAPVLLIHGALDDETPPDHSRRIAAALRSPHHLLIVDAAGHNQSLHQSWRQTERWIDETLAARNP